jgi:hypothetical protein
MNPKRIIIATSLIILISGFLTSCKLLTKEAEEVTMREAAPVASIQKAREVVKDVSLRLSAEKEEKQVVVSVILDNPNSKSITSVESWLSYDPDALEGMEIDITESPFEFAAPYENTFDQVNGLVMFGRANSKPITDAVINICTIVFELKTESTTMVDVYDYRPDLAGHASVNTLLDGIPYNILQKPESPVLIITN